MINLNPADFAQRQTALDPARSFIVQAPAGSGKTELLTQRFLKLLTLVEKPEHVLAITFTRKATREMQQRILQRLHEAKQDIEPVEPHTRIAVAFAREVLKKDVQHNWMLLSNPNRLRIHTIDSFCAHLAGLQPLLAGTAWNLRITDQADALYRVAARRVIETTEQSSNDAKLRESLVRVLVHLEGDANRLQELLVAMLHRRDQWDRYILPGGNPLQAGLDAAVKKMQRLELDRLQAVFDPGQLDDVIALLSHLGSLLDSGSPFPARRLADLPATDRNTPAAGIERARLACMALVTAGHKGLRKPGGLNARSGFPANTTESAGLVGAIKALLERWAEEPQTAAAIIRCSKAVPLPLTDGDRDLLFDLVVLLRYASAHLQVVFNEEGRGDFQSLAQAAVQALGGEGSPGDALLAEDNRISHILMDEFQDTSHTQFRLLERLVDGWQQGDGRSLFLVGDPMQSIYRFRQADVSLFLRICNNGYLGSVALQKLSLESNFRSLKELPQWVNSQFKRIFPDRGDMTSAAVSYAEFKAERGSGGQVVLHPIAPENDELQEAKEILQVIRQIRAEDDNQTVAVLVRSRKHLLHIARELTRNGTEYQAVEVDSLEARPVVRDLFSITRALLNPLDRIAWLALLRAPWCGLTTAELHRLAGEDRLQPLLQQLQPDFIHSVLADTSAERVILLRQVMNQALQARALQPLHRLVEVAWLRLGGPHAVVTTDELDNAGQFLRLLAEVEIEYPDDLPAELETRLARLYAQTGQDATVQLMTIHKAKGLEFDVVIIPGLEKKTGRNDKDLVRWQEFHLPDGHSAVLVAPMDPRGYGEQSLYSYIGQEENAREAYETQRVLYVAVTRAKKALHLFGRWNRTSKGDLALPPAGSFLRLLWPVFAPVIDPQSGEAVTAEDDHPLNPLLRLRELPLLECVIAQKPDSLENLFPGLRVPDPSPIALGKALHYWLEILHNHWRDDFTGDWIGQLEPALRSSLVYAGAPEAELSRLLISLRTGLLNALGKKTGRDILSPAGKKVSVAEMPVRRLEGRRLARYVMDRLIVDSLGVSVVDYKTGQDSEEMLGKWRLQLKNYAELVTALTGENVDSRLIYQPGDNRVYDLSDTKTDG